MVAGCDARLLPVCECIFAKRAKTRYPPPPQSPSFHPLPFYHQKGGNLGMMIVFCGSTSAIRNEGTVGQAEQAPLAGRRM